MGSKRRLKREEARERVKLRAKRCGSGEHFKVRYDDELSARNAAYAYGCNTRQDITHYRCSFCGFFHIGHTPKGGAKGR